MARSTAMLGILALAVLAVVGTIAASVATGDGLAELAAAIGLGVSVLAIAVLLSTNYGWVRNGLRVSLAAVGTAVVGLGAVALAVVTYMGAMGDANGPTLVANDVAPAVEDSAGLALADAEQSDNRLASDVHDVGAHPTIDEFMVLSDTDILRTSPGGTLTPPEVGLLREQLEQTRAVAEQLNTVEKANAAGYVSYTNDVPFMGAHFLNMDYVVDGVFDPAKPEGLLFSQLNGEEWKLVGVWFLIIPGINDGVSEAQPPDGYAGNLELWHEHYGLCTRNGIISENNTREDCDADGGRWGGDLRWMMHAWVYPEVVDNPEGVFTYLNAELFKLQTTALANIDAAKDEGS